MSLVENKSRGGSQLRCLPVLEVLSPYAMVMSSRCHDVSPGLSSASIVTKGCHPVGKSLKQWRRACVVMRIRKVTLAHLHFYCLKK